MEKSEKLLDSALNQRIVIPDAVNNDWKQVVKVFRKCGIGRRKARFFIITYTG